MTIVSPQEYNRRAFEVPLPPGLGAEGVVLADQIRSLDWRARDARLQGKVHPSNARDSNAGSEAAFSAIAGPGLRLAGRFRPASTIQRMSRQPIHEPTRKTRNRKPMDPDRRAFIAPWELRAGNLRVYYAVEDVPSPRVVIVAVGIKVRERLRIGGKDVEP